MAEFIQKGGTGGGSYARYYTAKLTVWEKPWDNSTNLPYSIEENKSRVGRKLELISGSSGRFSNYTIGWNINVDGQTNSGSGNQSLMSYNTSLTLYEDEIIVEHNPDGKKIVSCSASISSSGTYSPGNFSMSGELELTTIPRASKVFATNADIGSASTITINKADNSFTHTLEYSFEGLTGTIVTKTSQESVGWEVPKSFFQKIPEDPDGTATITCKTYSGDTLVGTSQTTMTAKVPTSGENSSMPIIESATAVDTNQRTINLTGSSSRLVNYFSNVEINAIGKCLDYGLFSVFKSNNQSMETTETSSNGTTTVNGKITHNSNEKSSFTIFIGDKRGLWARRILNEENGDFVIVPYIPLTMKADVERQSQTSSSVKLNFTGNFYNGYFDGNNTNFNNLTIKWRYKLTDSGSWITEGADDTTNGWHNLTLNTDFKYDEGKNTYQSNGDIVISDLFDYQKKYTIEICYKDELDTYTVQKPLPEGTPNHDYGVDSEGNNFFNVNGNYFRNGKNLIDVIKQYILEGNEYSLNDLCSMFNSDSMEFSQNTAWTKVKVPFTNSTVRGERLKFNSSNNSIVCNEDGIVDIEGMFNFYCNNSYITNVDYGLFLYKNGDYYAPLTYEYATSAAPYKAIGFYYLNIPVKKGDYFQLYVSTGGTGKIKTFAGFNTCVTAKYIKGV